MMICRNVLLWIGISVLIGMSFLSLSACCPDDDGDGYGDPGVTVCPFPETDCDNDNASVYPGAHEFCDGIDNQCPGDEGFGHVDENCVVQIPAGSFTMGDHFAEGDSWELPLHKVSISAFEMDGHEVTNAAYEACVNDGACVPPLDSSSPTRASYYGEPAFAHYPVIWVDRSQAEEYCSWAGMRLPTEAEWEYAARGRILLSEAYKRYPWGDTITCDDANHGRGGTVHPCYNHAGLENDTHTVGTYAANVYGLYDMAGNVWEWVQDWFDDTYYQTCAEDDVVYDPQGPAGGTERVMRGGSWDEDFMYVRISYRIGEQPATALHRIGFRCAR